MKGNPEASRKEKAKEKKSKVLCKWGKDQIKERLDELKGMVAAPQYLCRKCGRAAKEKTHLCKPEPL